MDDMLGTRTGGTATMTDFTYDRAAVQRTGSRGATARDGFFARTAGGLFRTLYEDFRAVPGEAWAILAVSTVLSNLFIALA